MNREALQSILQQPYQRERWLETLRTLLPATDLFTSPQPVSVPNASGASILQLGKARSQGGRQLAILEVTAHEKIDLARNRVGLRNLVVRLIDQAEYHGILAIFYRRDLPEYRFTFAARESLFDAEGNVARRETAARRYTYVLGPNETCRTAAERFMQLSAKAHGAELSDVIEAFSVEKLNKEFFADFCRAFDKVRDEIGKRHRWDDGTVKAEAQTLLNRLLFLYFVQRKGWLNRQRDYLICSFQKGHAANLKATTYYTEFLRPLFERLSTEGLVSILPDDDLPFLNGGLFNDDNTEGRNDPSALRHRELILRNETFEYIFAHLLEPYNFTIHEDSPNNYEVAIDPEMLGRIFEELVLRGEESDGGGKSARHDTGSHYTPRPIVHYICRETLAAWLESQPQFARKQEPRKIIDQLLTLDSSDGIDDKTRQELGDVLTPDEAAGLRDHLFELRACDPAVGSGAFPMGLLHELINLIRLCETRARGKDPVEQDLTWLYDTKKRVIERVIYGVDNQDRAIEICKLRLWLSLMVDHDLEVDPENCEARAFRKALKALDPLPNLDFKIRRANSLVDYIHGEPVNLRSLDFSSETRRILARLIASKEEFYAAHSAHNKRRSRFSIYESTAELAKVELAWARNRLGLFVDDAGVADLDRAEKEIIAVLGQIRTARKAKAAEQGEALERLQSWFDDPDKPTFVWQLDFAEVFHRYQHGVRSSTTDLQSEAVESAKYGFDIMIGNPPYVRLQTLTKIDPTGVSYYKENYNTAKRGNYDIYVVFVERGLELLDKRCGQLGYILPHKFFNQKYGEPLRKLISNGEHLRHVVHFGDQQIFPGATNYVCLLFLASKTAKECRFIRADNLKLWLATQQGTEGQIPSNRIGSAEWNITIGQGADLFERLMAQPIKLGKIANLFVGLQTSADTVFLFKSAPRPESPTVTLYSKALEKCVDIEAGILKSVVRSGEIGRYWARATALVIFPYDRVDNRFELLSERQMRSDYPKTWRYLLENRDLLESREHRKFAKSGWYQLYPKNLDMWEQPKVMLPYMITDLAAHYDDSGQYFVNVTTGGFGLTSTDKRFTERFLTGLLNSSVEDWFLKKVSTTFHGGYFAANKQFLVQLPTPLPSENQLRAAEVLVDYLLWLNGQVSAFGQGTTRPQDPAMTSFFEQVINAMAYELFFPEEIQAAGQRLFDVVNDAGTPKLDSLPSAPAARLDALFCIFQRLQAPGQPLRIALDKLQTLDIVRIIEGKT